MSEQLQKGSDMLDKLARENRAAIERYAEEIKRLWQERGYEQPPEDILDLGRFRRRKGKTARPGEEDS